MAGSRRHWKEKSGRFWARIAVPKALQPVLGKSELIEALGGDRRIADRNHAAAVARLQQQILDARHALSPTSRSEIKSNPITAADFERIVWNHYGNTLNGSDLKRASMPTQAAIEAEHHAIMQRIDAGEIDGGRDVIGMINAYTNYELKAGARRHYASIRARREAALRSALSSGDTRLVDDTVRKFVIANNLTVEFGSTEWFDLARVVIRAEIQALQRTLEQDEGNYSGIPSDPIVRPPTKSDDELDPVSLKVLFHDYIAARQVVGKHQDGAKQWEYVVEHLIKFLGHANARKITKRNLLDWRDKLLAEKKSPKTVADGYLASVRAVLRWAFENDRLTTNEAETVRQEVAKKPQTREKGYTTAEAIKILAASKNYQPTHANNPSNQESAHITAAKRWIPLLCAFTGARVTEMTQLRKEDLRQENGRWIVRITPDAGSVKTGQYRDVPLHRQIVKIGFLTFVESAGSGPLFHAAQTPEKYLANARVTAGRLSEWLQNAKLVPNGVQPSYGWRHRFKTLGRELGMSDRVLDAIQGHSGRTASDGYGDVSIIAKLTVIDALDDYAI